MTTPAPVRQLTARIWLRLRPRRLIRTALALSAGCAVLVGLEAVVRARLDTPEARAPTTLYAQPLVLEPGMRASRERVARHLDRLGYRAVRSGRVGIGEYRLGSDRWVIGRRPFRRLDPTDAGGLTIVQVDWDGAIQQIEDGDGGTLSRIALEPEAIGFIRDALPEDRIPVPLAAVPDQLVQAVLAVEDRRFYDHTGLDFRRMLGALAANVRAGRVTQGASTITQQLAKNLFLSARRTPVRKLREAAMALALELRYSKERILEAYLNEIYLGQDGAAAIHGVGRAAKYYFGKDVRDVGLAEAALLAGMTRGPNLYSPFRNRADARERRALVLRLMVEQGRTDERSARRASGAALPAHAHPRTAPTARYFRDFAVSRVEVEQGRRVAPRGMAVFTTLDAELQRAAERAVVEGLAAIERSTGRPRGARLQAALVAIEPRSGKVLAMVGGRDYGTSQFNRAISARRQPGSAFKPIVALAALSRPEGGGDPAFTLASVLEDEPLAVKTGAGLWEPVNYDGEFRGGVTLREALEQSLNVPFARIGIAIGPRRIVETGRALGIRSQLHPVPSLALGASEVTPLELTRAYGVLAAGGRLAELRTTLGSASGRRAYAPRAPQEAPQVVGAGAAYLVTSALQGVVDGGTGRGLRALGVWGPVAGKSGTSSDWRDAWFLAYTPALVVGVWVGFDDGRSIGLSGAHAALPIAGRFLLAALGSDGGEEFPVPDDVETVNVDPWSGSRGVYGCWGEPEVFLEGTAPESTCESDWPWSHRRLSHWGERLEALAELRAEELRVEVEVLVEELARELGVRVRVR